MDPFTFNTTRMIIGAFVVLPIILMKNYKETKKFSFFKGEEDKKETIRGGLICGAILVMGITSQQAGIRLTSVGKAGFLSSLSVMVVPLIGMAMGKKVQLYQWVGIVLAIIGVGLISLNQVSGINTGDIFMLMSSFFIAFHILSAGFFNKKVDSFQFSFLRFFFGGILCLTLALIFEDINFSQMKNALPAILFSGVIGSGIAFTLMAVSQTYLDSITTSIIMSLESVFAAIRWMLEFRFRSWRTISPAQISTPRAIPVIKVTNPSSIAWRIVASRSFFISASDRFSFSGRCPVKQQRCSRSSASFAILSPQSGLGHVPRLADSVASEECIKHCPHTTISENLTSLYGLTGEDCRSQFINVAVTVPYLVWHFWDFIVHITGNCVAFDMMDRLKLPVVAESYVVRRLFRPTVASNWAEVFIVVLYDVDPADTTAVWTLRTKSNDIDHIGIKFLHSHKSSQIFAELPEEMLLLVI